MSGNICYMTNISLTKECIDLIQKKVDSGRYSSASEVVHAGLSLLQDQDFLRQAKFEALKKDVQLGFDQLDRGEKVDGETVVRETQKIIDEAKARKKRELV